MNKKLIKDKQTGIVKLCQEDGTPCICPFQTKVPIHRPKSGLLGQQQQIEISLLEGECSSRCALFTINEENGAIKLSLECAYSFNDIELEVK